ncbi:hypothetical protein HK097_011072 [Rhizophlyctis rosea]|uniref:Uncharacterized protein n=1 Tax=Rhizophlyctis rosea TaxID=64517 RepID=A0AAD5S6V0_9FUNG|nr:hypothetical protein HK097_011072 [Rhizophlyctis rosea]
MENRIPFQTLRAPPFLFMWESGLKAGVNGDENDGEGRGVEWVDEVVAMDVEDDDDLNDGVVCFGAYEVERWREWEKRFGREHDDAFLESLRERREAENDWSEEERMWFLKCVWDLQNVEHLVDEDPFVAVQREYFSDVSLQHLRCVYNFSSIGARWEKGTQWRSEEFFGGGGKGGMENGGTKSPPHGMVRKADVLTPEKVEKKKQALGGASGDG